MEGVFFHQVRKLAVKTVTQLAQIIDAVADELKGKADVSAVKEYVREIERTETGIKFLDGQGRVICEITCETSKLNPLFTISASELSTTVFETATLDVTRKGDGEITVTNIDGTDCATATVSGTLVTFEGAQGGTGTYSVNLAESTNYNAASETVAVNVAKARADLMIGQGDFSDSDAVTFEISYKGDGEISFDHTGAQFYRASVSGNTLTATWTGTSDDFYRAMTDTITVNLAATAQYESDGATISLPIACRSFAVSTNAITMSVTDTATVEIANAGGGEVTITGVEGTDCVTVSLSDSALTFTGEKGGAATYVISVAATDGYDAASEVVSVTVNKLPANLTLSTDTIAFTMISNATLTFSKDGDGETSIANTEGTDCANLATNGNTITLTGKTAGVGIYAVSVQATERYESAVASFTVNVTKATPTLYINGSNYSPLTIYQTFTGVGSTQLDRFIRSSSNGTFSITHVSGDQSVYISSQTVVSQGVITLKVSNNTGKVGVYGEYRVSFSETAQYKAISRTFTWATDGWRRDIYSVSVPTLYYGSKATSANKQGTLTFSYYVGSSGAGNATPTVSQWWSQYFDSKNLTVGTPSFAGVSNSRQKVDVSLTVTGNAYYSATSDLSVSIRVQVPASSDGTYAAEENSFEVAIKYKG